MTRDAVKVLCKFVSEKRFVIVFLGMAATGAVLCLACMWGLISSQGSVCSGSVRIDQKMSCVAHSEHAATKTQSQSSLEDLVARIIWFYQGHIDTVGSCHGRFGFDKTLRVSWCARTSQVLFFGIVVRFLFLFRKNCPSI